MDDADLPTFLTETRAFLEPLWRGFKDERHPGWEERELLSFGMCRFTAAFLRPILEEATDRKWSVIGGLSHFHPADEGWDRTKGKPNSAFDAEDGVGGILTIEGIWLDHYWLTDGATIIDLTADQAGWEPILVTDAKDERYLANWKASFVKAHLKDVSKRSGEWRQQWFDRRFEPIPHMQA